MTYREGQIFCGANGSSGVGGINTVWAFINTIGGDMINTGWVQVTTQNTVGNAMANAITAPNGTIDGNSVVYNVYQSPGSNNQIGNTWYVALGADCNTNTRLVIVGPFMTWNLNGKNLAANFIPANAAGGMTSNDAANGISWNSSALGGNTLPTLGGGQSTVGGGSGFCNIMYLSTQTVNVSSIFSNTPNTLGTAYYYSVTIDRLIMGLGNLTPGSVTTTSGGLMSGQGSFANAVTWYIGTYDTTLPSYIMPNPLVMFNVYCTQTGLQYGPAYGPSGQGGTSGVLMSTYGGNQSVQGAVSHYGFTVASYQFSYTLGGSSPFPGDINAGGPYANIPQRLGIYSNQISDAQLGGFLGWFKDLYASSQYIVGLGRGDRAILWYDGIQYPMVFIGNAGASIVGPAGYSITYQYPWLLQK